MSGYAALTEVYEWLMSDAKLTPAGSVAAFPEVVRPVAAHGRVLDCSCGTGQLAVGLAELGLDVVAADASPGMVQRTRELAAECGVSLQVLLSAWSELPAHLDSSAFAVALLDADGSVHTRSERLSFWPFRYEQLVAELESVGLTVDASTFNPEAEEYRVVARTAGAHS